VRLFALCSVKGAPGTTTLALAMTSALTHDLGDAALVEADPAGGDLAGLLGLALDPGMATLAAASRHQSAWPDLRAHSQALPAGGWALFGSTDPTEATATIVTLATRLAPSLAAAVPAAVVDCGRFGTSPPTGGILNAVTATAVCMRARVPSIEAVRVRAKDLWQTTGGRVGLVVCGNDPYGAEEIQAATGLPVVGHVPDDDRACSSLVGAGRGRVDRLPLVRAARTIVDALAALGPDMPVATCTVTVSSNGAGS
jgi:hypothetical protein